MSSHPDDVSPHEEPSELGSLGAKDSSGLGSLASSARQKHIRQARRIMIVVGILLTLIQTAMYFVESSNFDHEVQKLNLANAAQPEVQARVAEFRRTLLLFHGSSIGVGILLVVLGLMIEKNPVAITASGLVLFIALQIAWGLVNPINFATGWIVKIIFVVGLAKALGAALADQKEARAAKATEGY